MKAYKWIAVAAASLCIVAGALIVSQNISTISAAANDLLDNSSGTVEESNTHIDDTSDNSAASGETSNSTVVEDLVNKDFVIVDTSAVYEEDGGGYHAPETQKGKVTIEKNLADKMKTLKTDKFLVYIDNYSDADMYEVYDRVVKPMNINADMIEFFGEYEIRLFLTREQINSIECPPDLEIYLDAYPFYEVIIDEEYLKEIPDDKLDVVISFNNQKFPTEKSTEQFLKNMGINSGAYYHFGVYFYIRADVSGLDREIVEKLIKEDGISVRHFFNEAIARAL